MGPVECLIGLVLPPNTPSRNLRLARTNPNLVPLQMSLAAVLDRESLYYGISFYFVHEEARMMPPKIIEHSCSVLV